MFDKLIESNSAGADFKPRRTFFMVSFVVVGIVFLSALVFDLYAANIDLGTDNFELVEILSPVSDIPEPKPPREQPRQKTETPKSEIPIRHQLIAPIEQTREVPDTISTTPLAGKTYSGGPVVINPVGLETDGANPNHATGTTGSSSSSDEPATVAETKLPDPPPVAEPKVPKVKSEGVVNGKATYLPPPPYPIPAKMVGAYGVVNVQVTIDEEGKVISSKAVSGHALLRGSAESAAWKARFSPTLLSRVPVKVTGVIVYNFKKS